MNGSQLAWVQRKDTVEIREIPLTEFLKYRRAGWLNATKEEFDAHRRKLAAQKAAEEKARKAAAGEEGGGDGTSDPDLADGDKPAVETRGTKRGAAGK